MGECMGRKGMIPTKGREKASKNEKVQTSYETVNDRLMRLLASA